MTATVLGRRMLSLEPSGAPKPEGTNSSVWLFVSCQLPGVLGESCGCPSPTTSLTGFENVR